jgi:hypothetical protein
MESDPLIIEASKLTLRTNARCSIRNAIPLAHRPLRNENEVDGLLCRAPAGVVCVNEA